MNGNWLKLGFNIVFFSPDSLTKLQQKIQRQGKENDPGRSSKANSFQREKQWMKRRFPGVLRLLLQGLAELAKQDNLFYAIC